MLYHPFSLGMAANASSFREAIRAECDAMMVLPPPFPADAAASVYAGGRGGGGGPESIRCSPVHQLDGQLASDVTAGNVSSCLGVCSEEPSPTRSACVCGKLSMISGTFYAFSHETPLVLFFFVSGLTQARVIHIHLSDVLFTGSDESTCDVYTIRRTSCLPDAVDFHQKVTVHQRMQNDGFWVNKNTRFPNLMALYGLVVFYPILEI